MDERVDEAVAAAVDALLASGVSEAKQLIVDIQANGEHPYRVITTNEPLPLVSVAIAE